MAQDQDLCLGLSDEELLAVVEEEVAPMVNIPAPPDIVRIYRHRNSIPQYGLAHGAVLEAMDAAEAANPGLAFAGNGYRGVGLNDCVLSAHRAIKVAARA